MKLEFNSQSSKHELKPVFIGSYTSKVSENSQYYASTLCSHFFLRHRMRDFVLEKQIVTHVTNNVTHVTKNVTYVMLLSWNDLF